MSMNGHAKRAKEAVEAVGFVLDPDATERGRWAYRHPNDPDRLVKVWAGMSEIAARKVRILADDIAGLSTHGEAMPKTIAETARIKRGERKRKEAAEAERGARERAAKAEADRIREQRIEAVQRARHRENELRELGQMMRSNRGWA